MTLHVTLAEAEAQLAELLDRAEAGEEVVIRRDGKPDLKVRVEPEALQGTGRRRTGIWAEYGPLEDPELFLRPDPELEADAHDGSIFPPE